MGGGVGWMDVGEWGEDGGVVGERRTDGWWKDAAYGG